MGPGHYNNLASCASEPLSYTLWVSTLVDNYFLRSPTSFASTLHAPANDLKSHYKRLKHPEDWTIHNLKIRSHHGLRLDCPAGSNQRISL